MKKDLNLIDAGCIYYVDLGIEINHCIAKVRPCVVVDMDRLTVTVIPLTNNDSHSIHSSEIPIPKGVGNLKMDSKLKMGQVQTVDRSKIGKMIGRLPGDYILKIQESIEERIVHRLEKAKDNSRVNSSIQKVHN